MFDSHCVTQLIGDYTQISNLLPHPHPKPHEPTRCQKLCHSCWIQRKPEAQREVGRGQKSQEPFEAHVAALCSVLLKPRVKAGGNNYREMHSQFWELGGGHLGRLQEGGPRERMWGLSGIRVGNGKERSSELEVESKGVGEVRLTILKRLKWVQRRLATEPSGCSVADGLFAGRESC